MSVPAPRLVELPQRRSPVRAAVAALRPRQWSKNLLVFAGIVFAAKLGDAARWGEAIACFVAYCALSSAAYLVNDLRDREHDRLHPGKRQSPTARAELPASLGAATAGGLASPGASRPQSWARARRWASHRSASSARSRRSSWAPAQRSSPPPAWTPSRS